ncbi:cell division protein FtsQ [Thermoanaerobacter kivui]|uniref:Cell division protein FtsQ n=1 Tax=Thermoanaerobacter kivui TaxID=2325 RepID=A0A097ASB2_THEKI|nr:FtsQ-type POTRA domain-containing protein [Thermoanaerobacter kivui]AIS52705.1 cell division protein FtsQ [Thermoanaerobacter kivui]
MASNNAVKKKKKFFVLVFIIALVVFVYIFMFKSSYFKIDTIKVVGNQILSYNDIKELAGINYGMNIFKVNPGRIEKNLLNSPYIKESKVEIKYPRTVEIRVKERRIVAQVQDKVNYLMIDKEGVVVKKDVYNPSLPLLVGIKVDKYEIGKRLSDVFEKNYLGELLGLIENTNFCAQITYINENHIVLTTKSGINVSFNNPYDIKYSFKFVELILKDLTNKGYHKGTIQVTGDNNPVFLP